MHSHKILLLHLFSWTQRLVNLMAHTNTHTTYTVLQFTQFLHRLEKNNTLLSLSHRPTLMTISILFVHKKIGHRWDSNRQPFKSLMATRRQPLAPQRLKGEEEIGRALMWCNCNTGLVFLYGACYKVVGSSPGAVNFFYFINVYSWNS